MPERPPEAEIAPWFDLYFTAFGALMHDRSYAGMGGVPTPIAYSAISLYAADHGVGPADLDVFVALIRALDEEWLLHVSRKNKEDQNG